MAAKTLINDPQLNEFLFDVITFATDKDRAKLTERQIRFIKTEKSTKNFITRSTLDEKLIMLQRLGVQYSFWIHRVKAMYPAKIKKLYKQKRKELSEDVVTELIESGLFIATDRHIAAFANLLGNGCHSENYLLNRDFYRIGDVLNNWEDIKHPTNENIRDGMSHIKSINKLILYASLALKDAKGVTQIGDLDYHLLMYLLNKIDQYVRRGTLQHYFSANYKKTVVSAAIKRLVETAHVEKNPVGNDSYMITALGIDTVIGLQRKIVNDTINF